MDKENRINYLNNKFDVILMNETVNEVTRDARILNSGNLILLAKYLFVVIVAVKLRLSTVDWMVNNNRIDVDEHIYMDRALEYADAIRNGEFHRILTDQQNNEHPQFLKLLFALFILLFGENSPFNLTNLMAARYLSISLAILVAILLVRRFNVWAALGWSISTWSLKYTTEVYLESGLVLFSLLAILSYLEWRDKQSNRWLILTGIFSGAAMASKYPAALGLLTVFCMFLFHSRKYSIQLLFDSYTNHERDRFIQIIRSALGPVVIWGLTSVLSFFLLNPRAFDLKSLVDSFLFHKDYSSSEGVQNTYLWAQFIWLFGENNPTQWQTMPVGYWDPLLFLLASVGIGIYIAKRSSSADKFRDYDPIVILFIFNLLFLVFWGTKWPQYLVYFILPTAVFAGNTIDFLLSSLVANRLFITKPNLQEIKLGCRKSLTQVPLTLLLFLLITIIFLGGLNFLPSVYITNDIDNDQGLPSGNDQNSNESIDWSIPRLSIGPNSEEISGNHYIWQDAINDDTGDGDYTYPTNEVFSSADLADISKIAVTNQASYLVISIEMVHLADVGWGSEIGQDLAAIIIGLDLSDYSSGPTLSEIGDFGFSGSVEVMISIMRTIKISDYRDPQNPIIINPEASLYNVSLYLNLIQVVLPKEDFGITESEIVFYVAAGLEEFNDFREIAEVQSEWYGSGGAQTSEEDADIYDIGFVSQEDQSIQVSNQVISGLHLDLRSLVAESNTLSDYKFELEMIMLTYRE